MCTNEMKFDCGNLIFRGERTEFSVTENKYENCLIGRVL